MTVGITVMKLAAATPAPVSSLNVTVGAASQNTGPATVTMTVETTATRLMPTAPTRVRSDTVCYNLKTHDILMEFCLYACQLYLSKVLITSCIV